MCQRLNTGERNNFYFGIFICIGPLSREGRGGGAWIAVHILNWCMLNVIM